jgi:predicted PurR-regulated permease PerM
LTACLLIGLVCTIAFVVMGVPYALVLGVLAGLLEFVPLVGPFVLAIVAAGAAGIVSFALAGIVLVFLAALRLVEDYVIYPRLIGHGVHLHPLAVILAVLAGAELGGVTGIFLSIPVVAILAVARRHWLEHRGSEGIVADLLAPPEPASTPQLPQARP